jgi:hypothetical protein
MKTIVAFVLLTLPALVVLGQGAAASPDDFDVLVQKCKAQLQAGSADQALASGEHAIRMNANRWEGYALAAGALMNLKRYEEAADDFSKAIERAPQPKQAGLRDLRRQCLVAESGASTEPKKSAPEAATQAEIVLWKSIENSTNEADFRSYLEQYPNGAFSVLAKRHLSEAAERQRSQAEEIKNEQQKRSVEAALGVSVFTLTTGQAHVMKIEPVPAVVVSHTEPGSLAEKIGLRQGMLIVEANKHPMKTEQDFYSYLGGLKSGEDIVFLVRDSHTDKKASLFLAGTMP